MSTITLHITEKAQGFKTRTIMKHGKPYVYITPNTCQRVMQMSGESYDYMVSDTSAPKNIKPWMWKKLSTNQRLNAHMQNICDNFDGISFTFDIIEE